MDTIVKFPKEKRGSNLATVLETAAVKSMKMKISCQVWTYSDDLYLYGENSLSDGDSRNYINMGVYEIMLV